MKHKFFYFWFLWNAHGFLFPISKKCPITINSNKLSTKTISTSLTFNFSFTQSCKAKTNVENEDTKIKSSDQGVMDITKNAIQSTWKALIVIVTLSSIALAIDAILKLKTQTLTIENLMPTIGNLLPLAAFGVAGAARLFAVLIRVARLLVTIPVVLGGAYFAAPSITEMLKHKPDLTTGGLVALLATPEVFEVIVLLTVVGGFIIWVSQLFFKVVQNILKFSVEIRQKENDE